MNVKKVWDAEQNMEINCVVRDNGYVSWRQIVVYKYSVGVYINGCGTTASTTE